MKRLFLDANVLFTAAHNPDGKAAFIITLGEKGAWRLLTSGFAAEEARRNLAAKFPEALKRFNELLTLVTIVPEQMDAPSPDHLTEKDKPIFRAACGCKATHLLTGDITHFGRYMKKHSTEMHGVTIMTPAQFLKSL
jgi:predicted nucleic acid-binding protein